MGQSVNSSHTEGYFLMKLKGNFDIIDSYDILLQRSCKSHITDSVNPFPKIFFIYFLSSEWVSVFFIVRKPSK